MTMAELETLVTGSLDRPGDPEPWSSRSGSVLASDLASIRPGRFYVIGINPGGDEGVHGDSANVIRLSLAAREGTNGYADQCWDCPAPPGPYDCVHCESGRLRPEKRGLMQQRICSLFGMLGEPPQNVILTNLIFARSAELSKLRGSKAEWKRRCRDVHVALLGIVRPSWIITLGFGEAFSSVRAFGRETQAQKPIPFGESAVAWHRRMTLEIQGGDTLEVGVLGVAHPGHRGFNRAGLAGSTKYPEALKRFIGENLLAGESA